METTNRRLMEDICEPYDQQGSISRLYKEHQQINKKKANSQTEYLTRTMHRQFTDKESGVTNKQAKIFNFISYSVQFSQFSRSGLSNSLRPHEPQHARPPCPSPTPGVHSDSCPSSRWCHPAVSSYVVPFSSCPQSLPASESFPMSHSSHESKYWSFSFSIIPSKEHPGLISFRMDWLDLLAV